ncbi:MAG: hypothetical protein GC205_13155 [Bacteroidetes bacterium]|nr:hypothetical protein [Bacteroidota bacterium]
MSLIFCSVREGCPPLRLPILCPTQANKIAEDAVPMTLTLYQDPAALPAAEWDRLVPVSRPFLRRTYLDLLASGFPGAFRYALARRQGEVIAAFVFQRVQLKGEDLRPYSGPEGGKAYTWPLAKTLVDFVRDRLHLLRWPIMTSGSPLAADEPGFAFAPGLSASDRSSLLAAAVREAADSFRGIRGYLISGHGPALNGFHRVPAEPDMTMPLLPEWSSFDHYLESLQSKYRVRARRIMRATEPLLRVELDAAGIRRELDAFNGLYRNVVQQAGFNLETLHEQYFPRMKESFGDAFRFVAWYQAADSASVNHNSSNGMEPAQLPVGFRPIGFRPIGFRPVGFRPVGFHTALSRDGVLHAHFIGLDYEANATYKLYPAMLYDYLQLGLDMRCRMLHLGRTAPEIKSTLGAVATPNEYQFRHEHKLVQSLIGPALLEAKIPEWTRRQPFRSQEHMDRSADPPS